MSRKSTIDTYLVSSAIDTAHGALRTLHFHVHGAAVGVVLDEETWRDCLMRIAEINSALVELDQAIDNGLHEPGSEAAQ